MSTSINLAKAREIIRRDAPYLMGLLYGLVPYPDTTIPTMAVTANMVLLYNPEWVATLTEQVAAGVLMHECSHVFREHISRFPSIPEEEKLTANIAMDIALNPSLIHAGWKLTPDALMPQKFNLPENKTAEWYFNALRQKREEQPDENNSSKGKGGVCAGSCGGIAKNPEHKEAEDKADGALGRTKSEQQRIIRSTANAIQQFAKERGRGQIPQQLVELADLLQEPAKVDWRKALSQVVRKATGRICSGGRNFSLSRPSKRSYTRGMLRPGIVQQLPEICIIRDTSGSMGQEQIAAAIIESMSIVRSAGVDTVWFLDADSVVAYQARLRISEFKSSILTVHGRGGTDFRPAIEACMKLRPYPNVTIYITDGDGRATPNPPPNMEFIWCIVPSYYKKKPANWGHHIVVSDSPVTLADAE